ncbi:MAG: hypothetical protein A2W19_16465 [Spirochaetes bacterium RBG_16_49_21]|nr:MAG: hypothetical protein A2W19_16465 [Spirochaetes bacterium RBG_16_49_21]
MRLIRCLNPSCNGKAAGKPSVYAGSRMRAVAFFMTTLVTVLPAFAGPAPRKATGFETVSNEEFLPGIPPDIAALKVSKGDPSGKIFLSWESTTLDGNYAIYRSFYESGPFIKIGETESKTFCDATADEGWKYWYMVCRINGGTPGVPAVDYGYRKPEIPKGLTVSEMLDGRNKPWPVPSTAGEREREKLHLRLYEKYYESYLMATFISLVGRFYINSGELLAYRDFKVYSWDPGNRKIYFEKPGIFAAKFYSRRFFRFIRDMHDMKIPYDELLPRVIKNAVIFCIPSGEKEIKEPDGRCRYIPNLEAVALGTEYIRDYEYWKSNTIFFATSDDEIYKRIREVQMRGY